MARKRAGYRRLTRWLSAIALTVLVGIAAFVLYEGSKPVPVSMTPVAWDFASSMINARTTVTNATGKPMTVTVHFEVLYTYIKGRYQKPTQYSDRACDVEIHLGPHASGKAACDLLGADEKEQCHVIAYILRYE